MVRRRKASHATSLARYTVGLLTCSLAHVQVASVVAVPLVGMLLGSACFPEALPAYALPFMQVRVWWPA